MTRFWKKVKKAGPNECWLWTASLNSHGYGQIYLNGNPFGAHRMSFLLAGNTIPPGHVIRHKCDNPICVNPIHLETGTHAENSADMVSRKRHINQTKTHCKRGHEFLETISYKNKTSRYCRKCNKIRCLERYYKLKKSDGI